MTLKVLKHLERMGYYRCCDSAGHIHNVDLEGDFEGVAPVDLVGRTIECRELIPLVKMPSGDVRLLPRAVPDVSVL